MCTSRRRVCTPSSTRLSTPRIARALRAAIASRPVPKSRHLRVSSAIGRKLSVGWRPLTRAGKSGPRRENYRVTIADSTRPTDVSSNGSNGPGGFDRTPPQDVDAERSVLGGMLLSKDAIADVVEVLRPGDYYYPANQLIHEAILDLYARGEPADPVTVSAELTKNGQLMRVGGRDLPAHADLDRPDRGQRRLLRPDRLRAGDPAAAGHGRHAHRPDGLRHRVRVGRRRGQRRCGGRPGAGRGLRGHRAPDQRGLRPHRRAAAADVGRARTDHGLRRRRHRHPDRLRPAGRDHQRPASGADDHRRGASRFGQVDAGARLRPVGGHQARQAVSRLLPRDGQDRDHDAAALGRGERAAGQHALGAPQRPGLAADGSAVGRAGRGAAVRRRLAEPDDDGDPGQGAPAAAAPRPAADRHRLPAADDERQARRVAPAGGQRVLAARSSCWPRSSRCR